MDFTRPVTCGLTVLALSLAMIWPPASRAAVENWVLALTWSPEACALQDRLDEPGPCVPGRGLLVHGLWPYEAGYPRDCEQRQSPSAASVGRLRSIMPATDQVLTQWRRHGTCSDLAPDPYFEKLKAAAERFRWPESFMRNRANLRISKSQLEKAFVELNPALNPDSIAIECFSHYLTEVRLCLDDALNPQVCGAQVGDICTRELIIRPQ